MSKRKKRPGGAAQKPRSTVKKPALVRPTPTPEQLRKQGNLAEAIRLLQAELQQTPPNDQRRRLLGHWLFEAKHYSEAAQTWLALHKAQSDDVLNVGIAFLNAEAWDQASTHLERALQVQSSARAYYLLALSQLREKSWWGADEETALCLVALLQKARALPDCPPEAYLRLDYLQRSLALRGRETDEEQETWNRTQEQSFKLLEEAFSLYPDHEEIRLRFAASVIYWKEQYETGLLLLAPLLQRSNLSKYQFEEVAGLCVEAGGLVRESAALPGTASSLACQG